jgi:NitT/TauT family transport system substrate-binding protein
MKRRMSLKVLGTALSLALCASSALAAPHDKLTLLMNYTVNGALAPFYLGKVNGYYAQEGIDIKLVEGHGSGPTVQAVATKNVDIGFADFGTMVKVAAAGAPVKTIGILMQKNPAGVVGLASKNINKPQDIKGKIVAVAPGDASSQMWPMFLQKVGLKDSDFKTITGNQQTTINAVITGRADLLVGFGTIPLIEVENATKKKAHALLFADYGVNIATLGFVAQDDMIKNNPDLLKRFMRATNKAFEASIKNPGAAVDALMKEVPNAGSRDLILSTLVATSPFYHTADTANQPLFKVDPKSMAVSVDEVVKIGKLDKSANDVNKYYTSAFLP